jgi:outer membrane protein OmpA-like peptidoglycan-associated protein
MRSTITIPFSGQKILSALLVGIFSFLLVPDTSAQNFRPEDTFFIKPRVGVAWHLGDTEKSPFNFNMDNWKVEDEPPPFSAGLELGYQYSQTMGVSLGYQLSNHPLAFHYGDTVPDDFADPAGYYSSGQLLFRFGAPSRIAPFVAIGAHATKGQHDLAAWTYGPAAGIGLDIVMSDRVSLVVENLANLTFPDDGFDAASDTPISEDSFLPFDLMNSLTLGLKFNFKSAFTPVEILSMNCPSATLETGETGTFTASVNADATQPVAISWDFGDGSTATGMTASHSFSSGGTYTVTVTANNGEATDSSTCTVTVREPVPASIISMNASQTQFDVCEPVEIDFDASADGDDPVTFSWDFGDGETGEGENVSHTYTEPGTYTVTLTATNEAGTDTRSITITAEECIAEICFDITEMNSVYFGQNSSTLTEEGIAALNENLDIFEQCPNLGGMIVGYAAPGERNPEDLSADRAQAVEDHYVQNGMAASRFQTEGRGVLPGTTKKEGAAQARRTDTIPVQTEDM